MGGGEIREFSSGVKIIQSFTCALHELTSFLLGILWGQLWSDVLRLSTMVDHILPREFLLLAFYSRHCFWSLAVKVFLRSGTMSIRPFSFMD